MATDTLAIARTAAVPASTRTAGTDPIIDIKNLSVSYGPVKAVRNVTLSVKQGEIFGLLGPNGAGKTTTLSAIEGLVKPETGSVHVLGLDALRQSTEVKRRLGISLQSTSFFSNLKLSELLTLYAGLYEVYLSKQQVADLLARFELSDKANAYAEQLSGGQRQRVALALAIANNPEIVILDEPTTGLDPQARRHVWDMIRQLRDEGRTVLITTHYMEEAQELCSRIGIIDGGELIALDTPGTLIHNLKADSVITANIRLSEDSVQALPGVTKVRREGDKLIVHTNSTQETTFALQSLAVEQRQLLTDLSVKQPDLEDVFIALTGKQIRQS